MITFDTTKIYLMGILIALMYGLSPVFSSLLFDSAVPGLATYLIYFVASLAIFFLIVFPSNRYCTFKIIVSETRLVGLYLVAATLFIVLQIAYYGDFTSAFIVSYTDRTGVEMEGPIRYIFYPITTLFTTLTLLFSTFLYAYKDQRSIIKFVLLFASLFLIAALGSRNILLWCLSGVLALIISKMKFRNIFLLAPTFYLFAVFFAFVRNTGLLSVILGTDSMAGELNWIYFDPNIHEFGSSYRTFELIRSNGAAVDALRNAPYGQVSSFFINQLPSLFKPNDFVSFTEFISKLYAEPGEGIGSSPMTEALTSNYLSVFSLIILGVSFFWPVYYQRRLGYLSFACAALSIALYLNIWRIGSAEVFKMYVSFIVVIAAVGPIIGLKIKRV